jgi:hypothetical protein
MITYLDDLYSKACDTDDNIVTVVSAEYFLNTKFDIIQTSTRRTHHECHHCYE